MVRYRIVDDRDGKRLAEHARAEQALLSFGHFVRDPQVRARISVVLLDHKLGGMVQVTSMRSVRSRCNTVRRARSH
jgi:hypothetical protein